MGYNSLGESGMSADEMRAEATRLVKIINSDRDKLSQKDRDFVLKMSAAWEPVSFKQLFYLRDIKSRLD